MPVTTLPDLPARLTPALLVAALLATTVGCSPTPSPPPTPTPTPLFATEEEAFAAAEDVYREYNEAVNAERRGAPDANPRDYLVGLALESDTDARNILASRGLTIEGDGVVADFTKEEIRLGTSPRLVAEACLDVGSTHVINDQGSDVTPPDRSSRVALRITMLANDGRWLVAESTAREGGAC